MSRPTFKNAAVLIGIFLLVWFGLRFIFPVALPFLLGVGLALAAEPLVHLCEKHLRLPRSISAGIGTGATLLLLVCVLVIVGSLLVRELTLLAGVIPDLTETVRQGLFLLEDFLLGLAGNAPQSIQPLLTHAVLNLFSSGTAIMDRITARIPAMASAVLIRVPNGALTVGTGILSGFMVSARLPKIRNWLKNRPAAARLSRYAGTLKRVRTALAGWLKAQAKLTGLSFAIVCTGLLILQIPKAPIWALLIALVDAVPVLGTGTVLLPWSLICLLQHEPFQAFGLLAIYAVTMLTRSAMEPRLVGRQLGLDPLVALVALYAGYQLWGVGGMLLAPVLSVAAMELTGTNSG